MRRNRTIWVCVSLALFLYFAGTVCASESIAADSVLPAPCEEPEAKVLDKPTARLEHWPAKDIRGGEMRINGTYVLEPTVPGEGALCAWHAVAPSGHRMDLSLKLDVFGKAWFRFRTMLPDGGVIAENSVPAKNPIYGYWQVRCLGIFGSRVEEEKRQFQPGSMILAKQPEVMAAEAAKRTLLDPPQKIAEDIKAGRETAWEDIFNLDSASRRYLLPSSIEALRSLQTGVREAGAMALLAIGEPAREALPILIAALDDENDFVAGYAAAAIKWFGPEEVRKAVPELIEVIYHKGGYARRNSILALLTLEAILREARKALFKTVKGDTEKDIRMYAIRALGMITPMEKKSEEVLLAALSDQDARIVIEAAKALAGQGRALYERLAAMTALLKHNDSWPARIQAAEALGSMPLSTAPLISALSDSSLPVRESVYLSLKKIDTPGARKAMENYDATELSPRFWEMPRKLAGETGPGREQLKPMIERIRKNFLPWRPGQCQAEAKDNAKFVLYKSPALQGVIVSDLSKAGVRYSVGDFDTDRNPLVTVTFLEYRADKVRIRTEQGKEGWTMRTSFVCKGIIVAEPDGRIVSSILDINNPTYPVPGINILSEEKKVRFWLIEGRPYLATLVPAHIEGKYVDVPNIAFELDPATLEIIDVRWFDAHTVAPYEYGRLPAGFPGGFSGGGFEAGGRVFFNSDY